eukprot:350232-Chlamydomonas_euryale.AAC.5
MEPPIFGLGALDIDGGDSHSCHACVGMHALRVCLSSSLSERHSFSYYCCHTWYPFDTALLADLLCRQRKGAASVATDPHSASSRELSQPPASRQPLNVQCDLEWALPPVVRLG